MQQLESTGSMASGQAQGVEGLEERQEGGDRSRASEAVSSEAGIEKEGRAHPILRAVAVALFTTAGFLYSRGKYLAARGKRGDRRR